MTTAITSPAPRRAPFPDTGRGLFGLRFRSRRGRRVAGAIVSVAVLGLGSVVVVSDVRARSEIRTTEVSVQSRAGQLTRLRAELSAADHRLKVARDQQAAVTRYFDAAQSALSATQKSLATDQAGLHAQGVDLGALDSCLSGLEQALNQIAVGQTPGGLASLKASSSSCSTLDRAA